MLTNRQEKYVRNLVKGMSQRKAYRDAYPSSKKWKDSVVDSEASSMLSNPKVFNRYQELQKKAENSAIMSAEERKLWLTKVIKGEVSEEVIKYFDDDNKPIIYPSEANINTKIKAIDVINKMEGVYITKLEGKLSVEKLEDIL